MRSIHLVIYFVINIIKLFRLYYSLVRRNNNEREIEKEEKYTVVIPTVSN